LLGIESDSIRALHTAPPYWLAQLFSSPAYNGAVPTVPWSHDEARGLSAEGKGTQRGRNQMGDWNLPATTIESAERFGDGVDCPFNPARNGVNRSTSREWGLCVRNRTCIGRSSSGLPLQQPLFSFQRN